MQSVLELDDVLAIVHRQPAVVICQSKPLHRFHRHSDGGFARGDDRFKGQTPPVGDSVELFKFGGDVRAGGDGPAKANMDGEVERQTLSAAVSDAGYTVND